MHDTITDHEIETLCQTLGAEAPPTTAPAAWAFCCTLRPTHQRGQHGYSARASDLGLPVEVWPARLLCQLPKGQRLLFAHAYRGGAMHVYKSVKPQAGHMLVIWQD